MAHRAPYGARRSWLTEVLVGLAAVLIVAAVAYVAASGGDDGQNKPPEQDKEERTGSIAGCREQWRAQVTPLSTADHSMEQWQTHITAMNQLVAGEISLDEATQFWESTRVSAIEKVEAFEAAYALYATDTYHCASQQDGQDLMDCQHSIAERNHVLDTAATGIGTWKHHVVDMDKVRAGVLSPERAIELWNKYWKQGLDELLAYHRAIKATDNQVC